MLLQAWVYDGMSSWLTQYPADSCFPNIWQHGIPLDEFSSASQNLISYRIISIYHHFRSLPLNRDYPPFTTTDHLFGYSAVATVQPSKNVEGFR
eukprot:scaffold2053_cov112-Cylindrotheca_fusiformis.AAC.10